MDGFTLPGEAVLMCLLQTAGLHALNRSQLPLQGEGLLGTAFPPVPATPCPTAE